MRTHAAIAHTAIGMKTYAVRQCIRGCVWQDCEANGIWFAYCGRSKSITIYAEEHFILEGDYVEKLGGSLLSGGGYRDGDVYITCSNISASPPSPPGGPSWVIYCANQAGYQSNSGDSGGAMFLYEWRWNHSVTSAILYGVHFGSQGYFSGISQIEGVFGPS